MRLILFIVLKTKRCIANLRYTLLFALTCLILFQNCDRAEKKLDLSLSWRISLFEQQEQTVESIYPAPLTNLLLTAQIHPDSSTFYALNPKTGKIQWQYTDNSKEIYYNLQPVEEGNKIIIPLGTQTKCFSENGTLQWSVQLQGNPEQFLSSFSRQTLLQSTNNWNKQYSELYFIRIKNGKAECLYRFNWADSTKTILRTPVKINKNTLLFTSITMHQQTHETFAKWHLFDLKTKTITHEGSAFRANANGRGVTKQPIVVGNKAILMAYDEVFCLDFKQKKECWRTTLPRDMLTAQPIVDNNRVFCPTEDGFVYCLNLADGSILWKTKAAGTPSRPIICEDILFVVGGADGVLYAFSTKDGTLLTTKKSPNHDYLPNSHFRRFIGTDRQRQQLLLFDGNSFRAYQLWQ